jgi:hypothetical protein
MKIQRRFAPTRGLFRPESVARFARIRSQPGPGKLQRHILATGRNSGNHPLIPIWIAFIDQDIPAENNSGRELLGSGSEFLAQLWAVYSFEPDLYRSSCFHHRDAVSVTDTDAPPSERFAELDQRACEENKRAKLDSARHIKLRHKETHLP